MAVARRILKGLEYRLAVVDAATTTAIVQDTRPGVANDALAVFIGYHAIGTMKSVYGIPVYEEVAYWGAVNPPPDHYVEAVRSILTIAGPDELESVAKYAGRHFRENNPGQDVWAQFLVPMVTPPSTEEQKSANTAALHLAWGEAPGIDDVITAVIAGNNVEVMTHLIDGFEKRLDAGRGDAKTIARLMTIAGSASAEAKRAEKVAKKFEKKLK